MRNTVTLKTPFHWCETSIDVCSSGPHVKSEGAHATISIRTGASHVQTYATRDDLKALAALLLQVAEAA